MIVYLLAILVATIVIETLIALLLRRRGQLQVERSQIMSDVPLVNLFTQPLANLAFRSFGAPFAVVELAVILVELLIYKKIMSLSWRSAAGLSIATNGATILVSLMI